MGRYNQFGGLNRGPKNNMPDYSSSAGARASARDDVSRRNAGMMERIRARKAERERRRMAGEALDNVLGDSPTGELPM